MTKREKIIVGTMALAAVLAGADWAVRAYGTGAGIPGKGREKVDLDVLVAQVGAQMEASRLGQVSLHVRERADLPWRPDLFRLAPEGPSLAATIEEAASPPPAYTGYLNFGLVAIGILNGIEYEEGEWTADGNYRILRLGPSEAELLPRGEDVSIVIPLEP